MGPFGSAKIGSKAYLWRHRAVECKHGCVVLWACIDDFRPKYSKHGGYVSPSWASGLGVPNGVVAKLGETAIILGA